MLSKVVLRGTWVAQLNIQLLVLAQVMMSGFVGSSFASGSALLVWSLLGILPLSSFSAPSLFTHRARARARARQGRAGQGRERAEERKKGKEKKKKVVFTLQHVFRLLT